jgi:hypothetical protein
MALADLQAFKDSIEKGKPYFFTKNSATSTTNKLMSMWTTTPNGGAVPTVPVTCNADTLGALFREPKITTLTNAYFISQLELACATNAYTSLLLIDRLSHQGGLSGTATAIQTTNLPTAALPRYTDGVGVMAALEIYTLIGTLAQTATVSYTNEAGIAGRTSKAVVIGAANDNAAGRFIPIPPQDDDIGIRSVESVTPSSSTATAGNYGVTLFKPLMLIPNLANLAQAIQQRCLNSFIGGYGCCPEILDNACLQFLAITNTSSTGAIHGAFHLAEA